MWRRCASNSYGQSIFMFVFQYTLEYDKFWVDKLDKVDLNKKSIHLLVWSTFSPEPNYVLTETINIMVNFSYIPKTHGHETRFVYWNLPLR